MAVIIKDGIKRMYVDQEDVFYYLTVYNENYMQPEMPRGTKDSILKGAYRFRKPDVPVSDQRKPLHLFGSGSIMLQVLEAQDRLAEQGVAATVWSVTSYTKLYRDAVACDDWNRQNPNEKPRIPHISTILSGHDGVFIAATDYMKVLPASIGKWIPGELICLGTDGYGLSESREELRDFFGIDSKTIVAAALGAL